MGIRLLLCFHDAALPHSRYLLEGFASHPEIIHLTVAYPEKRGSDLIFSAGGNGDIPQKPPYQMVSLKSSLLRPKWVRWLSLLKAIRKNKPDYVVVLDEALYPNTLLAGLAVYWLNYQAPVVFYGFENIHQSPPWSWLKQQGPSAFWAFARKTLRYIFLDRLLHPIRQKVISGGLVCYKECADVILKTGWHPLLQEQWWGVNTNLFNQAAENTKQHHIQWQALPNQTVVGFVGRYVPEKGVIDLLHALKLLGGNYLLVCIGGGPQEKEIIQTANSLGVSEQLRLLSPMSSEVLAEHMAAMDLLALPSHTDVFWKEQYGRVLVEAMAAAVPVIGSRSGAIPYVINDDRRTFEEGDISQICKAIKVAESMTIAEKKALQVRAKEGDIRTFVQSYIDLYHEITCK